MNRLDNKRETVVFKIVEPPLSNDMNFSLWSNNRDRCAVLLVRRVDCRGKLQPARDLVCVITQVTNEKLPSKEWTFQGHVHGGRLKNRRFTAWVHGKEENRGEVVYGRLLLPPND